MQYHPEKFKKASQIKDFFRSLGPGIIIAALVFGPSKITITSKLGAEDGFSLLWVVVLAIFFMIIFTSMSARIGLATNQSLLTTISQKWGKPISIALGIGIFLVSASFQAGNSIGVGISIAEMTNTSPLIWIILFNLIGIGLLFFKSFYKVLEKLMILLIALMLFAFLSTLIMVKPDFSKIAGGLKPSIPPNSLGLMIAFTASTLSIVAAFYQSYMVQEKRRNSPEAKQINKSTIGIIILGLMSAMVLICAATVLYPKGIKVNTATDMARALQPLFGKYASFLFLSGLFGASFSSLIGNASVGGTLLGDALGYKNLLSSFGVRSLIALIMLIGAIIAIVFGKMPLHLIVLAQTVTIFIVPFVGIAMYSIANDGRIMGGLKNKLYSKIAGGIGLLIVIFLAFMSFKTFFLK
jgi:Mn2+/Fe2+ NRAMP family transporter